jgi:hypothetical protein
MGEPERLPLVNVTVPPVIVADVGLTHRYLVDR